MNIWNQFTFAKDSHSAMVAHFDLLVLDRVDDLQHLLCVSEK
jgi:hypothetical protein